jgi:hypothetical protein
MEHRLVMRRPFLLLSCLLLIGLTAGASSATADVCKSGQEQCPEEYGGGCVPEGSVCCPDGTYGEAGSVCCGNEKTCSEGFMCGGPDECIPMTSKRACSDRAQYCDVGSQCTEEMRCVRMPGGNRPN